MAIGIVELAKPAIGDIMPWHLARAFRRSETHQVWRNEYANGEVQVLATTVISRKTWEMDLSLIGAHLQRMREYFEWHRGSTDPFYFYDVAETGGAYPNAGALYDVALYDVDVYPGGDVGTITGRYCVRFDCPYNAVMGLGSLRGALSIRLIELAAEPTLLEAS